MASLTVSRVGLYDDARFPGRLLVSLIDHYDHLDELPDQLLLAFNLDIRRASIAVRSHLGADRVNVAVLGNQVSHVHAHVIPRRAAEPRPANSPWQDPRQRSSLDSPHRQQLVGLLAEALTAN